MTKMTQLRTWLKGEFKIYWQALEELFNFPQTTVNPAFIDPDFSTSKAVEMFQPIKRGQLLEFSSERQLEPIVLVIGLTPTDSPKFNISVEVCPVSDQDNLPDNLKLILLDEMGEVMTEVEAEPKQKTEIIELFFTKGLGDSFTVKVVLNEVSFTEGFEI